MLLIFFCHFYFPAGGFRGIFPLTSAFVYTNAYLAKKQGQFFAFRAANFVCRFSWLKMPLIFCPHTAQEEKTCKE